MRGDEAAPGGGSGRDPRADPRPSPASNLSLPFRGPPPRGSPGGGDHPPGRGLEDPRGHGGGRGPARPGLSVAETWGREGGGEDRGAGQERDLGRSADRPDAARRRVVMASPGLDSAPPRKAAEARLGRGRRTVPDPETPRRDLRVSRGGEKDGRKEVDGRGGEAEMTGGLVDHTKSTIASSEAI